MQIPYSAETLSIEGPDALAFAQAQFSSKADALDIDRWQFSAWLDAQGRVRALFHLARLTDDLLVLLLRGGNAEVMAAALKRFVFRSRLHIEACAPRTLATGTTLPLHTVVRSTDDAWVLGCGDHSMEIGTARDSDNDWRLPQVRARWPWLPDKALDTFLPASLELDQLHATALDKGCYPGQEIVARLHYRGGNKRHMHRVELSQVRPAGSVLREHDNDNELMHLLDVVPLQVGATALAVMRDEVAERIAMGAPITCSDNTLVQASASSWTSRSRT
jgi:tRNA-modifying protein YgfZ